MGTQKNGIRRSLMKIGDQIRRRDRIIGLIVMCNDILILSNQAYLLYAYHFTDSLFLFMYPNWVLLTNAALLCVGIVLSIMLLKGRIKLKPLLLLTILIWVIVALLLTL